MDTKCPKCGGPTEFLAGEPAHFSNLYCADESGCGWSAWGISRETDRKMLDAMRQAPYQSSASPACSNAIIERVEAALENAEEEFSDQTKWTGSHHYWGGKAEAYSKMLAFLKGELPDCI